MVLNQLSKNSLCPLPPGNSALSFETTCAHFCRSLYILYYIILYYIILYYIILYYIILYYIILYYIILYLYYIYIILYYIILLKHISKFIPKNVFNSFISINALACLLHAIKISIIHLERIGKVSCHLFTKCSSECHTCMRHVRLFPSVCPVIGIFFYCFLLDLLLFLLFWGLVWFRWSVFFSLEWLVKPFLHASVSSSSCSSSDIFKFSSSTSDVFSSGRCANGMSSSAFDVSSVELISVIKSGSLS